MTVAAAVPAELDDVGLETAPSAESVKSIQRNN